MLPFAETIGKDGVSTRFRMWSDQHQTQLLGTITIKQLAGQRYEWVAESEAVPTGTLNASDLNGQFALAWVAGVAWALATVTGDKAVVVSVDGRDVSVAAPNGFHQRLLRDDDGHGGSRELGLVCWGAPNGDWGWVAVAPDDSVTFTRCKSITDAVRLLRSHQSGK